MREILFRGYDREAKCWRYGDLIQKSSDDIYIVCSDYENHEELPGNPIKEWFIYQKVDPATIGQWTGLKDRNGKRIFDGDRVKSYRHSSHEFKFVIGIVQFGTFEDHGDWNNEHVGFYIELFDGSTEEIVNPFGLEITGTIHDGTEGGE